MANIYLTKRVYLTDAEFELVVSALGEASEYLGKGCSDLRNELRDATEVHWSSEQQLP